MQVSRKKVSAAFIISEHNTRSLKLALKKRRTSRFVLDGRSHFNLHRRVVTLVYMQLFSKSFVALEKFCIVISFSIHAFPRKDRVATGGQAAQGKPSALIAEHFSIAVGTLAETRFRYGDNHCVGHGFILLIGRDALAAASIAL